MEHILVSHIRKHLDRQGILNDSSTSMWNSITFIDDLAKEMQGEAKRMSLLWTLARQDKVPHNGLLYKLLKCGIDDNTLQWLTSFLEKRRQSV